MCPRCSGIVIRETHLCRHRKHRCSRCLHCGWYGNWTDKNAQAGLDITDVPNPLWASKSLREYMRREQRRLHDGLYDDDHQDKRKRYL